ncbi:hypothetical protein CSV75_01820 [Sporosarcina sp. P18a]|uniref:hypothetical protein n=1 Tax=Sporosarcina sp. P18a TaxID=2048259 RepID=UPI000C16325B|nr:hypothetical protein [Sporosarcina sp. P18a]PIC80554.1 hypothetical protein CSV75_01820 [Sporosarcina sp. P18a]
MANQEIHEPTNYSQEIRKLQTTDPSHADVFNPLFERLINNDVFLKSLTERLIQEHTHSGADGEGSQIPLANIKMPVGEGEIVTDKELAHHINERNPHGTRAVDVGAASSQEVATHLADITKHITFVERTSWNGKIDSSEKGHPNGVATLGVDGLIIKTQVPRDIEIISSGIKYSPGDEILYTLIGEWTLASTASEIVIRRFTVNKTGILRFSLSNRSTSASGRVVPKLIIDNKIFNFPGTYSTSYVRASIDIEVKAGDLISFAMSHHFSGTGYVKDLSIGIEGVVTLS